MNAKEIVNHRDRDHSFLVAVIELGVSKLVGKRINWLLSERSFRNAGVLYCSIVSSFFYYKKKS